MNILLSYASESDKGEGVHYKNVFERLGHDVVLVNVGAIAVEGSPGASSVGYPADISIHELVKISGGADLFVYVEPLGLLPRGMESSPIPTACVISDVHRNLVTRVSLARFFDHVFLYQRDYKRHFTDHQDGAVQWMPYACDEQYFRDLNLPRDYDIGFVGQLFNYQGRKQKIDALRQRYVLNDERYYLQSEISEVYSRSKIVVNVAIGDDLNFRVFEGMATGAMVLTKRLETGQEELFEEGVHFTAFDEQDELLEKAEYYLTHDDERIKIAKAGYDEFLANHTLSKRISWMLQQIADGPGGSAPVRHMPADQVVLEYAGRYERSGNINLLLALAASNSRNRTLRARILFKVFKSVVRRVVKSW